MPIDPEEHIAVGVAKGAPRAALEASVTELGASTAKGLVNLVRRRRAKALLPCGLLTSAVWLIAAMQLVTIYVAAMSERRPRLRSNPCCASPAEVAAGPAS